MRPHRRRFRFLAGPLLSHGIALEPTYATSKNPIELQRFLGGAAGMRKFDLVFFSPFTYAFHLDYSRLLQVRTSFENKASRQAIVETAKSDTLKTLRLLGDLFEAPIFVHNSTNIQRHNRTFPDRVRHMLTRRARREAREAINTWLPAQLAQLNSTSFQHFFLLDETALLRQHSEYDLGALFYDSDLQHPAEFGRAIAGAYQGTTSSVR